jgi:hypothetical protein
MLTAFLELETGDTRVRGELGEKLTVVSGVVNLVTIL